MAYCPNTTETNEIEIETNQQNKSVILAISEEPNDHDQSKEEKSVAIPQSDRPQLNALRSQKSKYELNQN